MKRRRGAIPRPEAVVEGRPVFTLRDEDREAIAEILADLLIGALDRREDPDADGGDDG